MTRTPLAVLAVTATLTFSATLVALGADGSARAQYYPEQGAAFPTDDDPQLIGKAISEKLGGQPVGTTATWDNPATGNSGAVTLIERMTRGGKECVRFGLLIRVKLSDRSGKYTMTECLNADGRWLIEQ